MSPLKVVKDDGTERLSKGKISGAIIAVVGAWQVLAPLANTLFGWHLPLPHPDIQGLAANAIAGVVEFALGLGIHSIRSNTAV